MNQICCIGHITHDRIITPQRTMEMAGGTALYFSWALHAIDPTFDFSLVTKVGDESMDEVHLSVAGHQQVVVHECREGGEGSTEPRHQQ